MPSVLNRNEPIRGKSKSGRVWRPPGERSSKIVVAPGKKGSGKKGSWKKRLLFDAEKKSMKEMESRLREAAKKEREEKRKKLEEKRQRVLENERKGEVVQQITNIAKLKRMSKKQMRAIQKR